MDGRWMAFIKASVRCILFFLFVFYFSVYVKFIDKVRKGTSVLTNEALIGLHVDVRLFTVCLYDSFFFDAVKRSNMSLLEVESMQIHIRQQRRRSTPLKWG